VFSYYFFIFTNSVIQIHRQLHGMAREGTAPHALMLKNKFLEFLENVDWHCWYFHAINANFKALNNAASGVTPSVPLNSTLLQ